MAHSSQPGTAFRAATFARETSPGYRHPHVPARPLHGRVRRPHSARDRSGLMARRVESFAPASRADARVLVLGSMPGEASLRAGEYYAHARNHFWPFMGELVGAVPQMPYVARLSRLHDAGVALWDVLQQCERSGSLDSAIVGQTARPNDFAAFLGRHPGIRWVLFNGARAESDFLRLQAPVIGRFGLACRRLPSTSPANASQRREDKLREWREALRRAGASLVGEG